MNRDRINQMRTALLAVVAASALVALVLQPALAGPQSPHETSSNSGLSSRVGALGAQPPLATTDGDEEETPGPISADKATELIAELQEECGANVAVPDLTGLAEDQAEALVEPLIEACEEAAEPTEEPDPTEAPDEGEADDPADADDDGASDRDVDDDEAEEDDDEADEGDEQQDDEREDDEEERDD